MQGFDTLVKSNATTDDTLQLIVRTVLQFSKSAFVQECVKKLCPAGATRSECMRNVFNFYCRNVKYVLDEEGRENVWTPALTILEGKGDCKKAATFIAAVLHAKGIPAKLKHVFYNGNDKYTHIYVIVPDDGDTNFTRYTTLDPTNNCAYNAEVNHDAATVYPLSLTAKPVKMNLHQMGNPNNSESLMDTIHTGCKNIQGEFDQIAEWTVNAPSGHGIVNPPSAQEVEIAKKILPNLQGKTKGQLLSKHLSAGKSLHEGIMHTMLHGREHQLKHVMHIPLHVQRGAFLELIKNNVDGIATNLATALGTKPDALNPLWHLVGGDINHLKATVIEGAKKQKADAMKGPDGMEGPEYIGGFWSSLLHVGSTILGVASKVVSVIPGVGPIVGGALGKVSELAEKASQKAQGGIVDQVATAVADKSPGSVTVPLNYPQGANTPYFTSQSGSVAGSIGGAIFKSILLITYIPTTATYVAIVALLVFVGTKFMFKKIKSNGL